MKVKTDLKEKPAPVPISDMHIWARMSLSQS